MGRSTVADVWAIWPDSAQVTVAPSYWAVSTMASSPSRKGSLTVEGVKYADGSSSVNVGSTSAHPAASNAAKQYRQLAEALPTAAKAFGTAASVVAGQRVPEGERPLNLGLAPKTIFNQSITNQRSFSTMSVPLSEIKALGMTTIIVEQNAIAALKLADRAIILSMGQVVFDGDAEEVLASEALRQEHLAI